MGTHFRHVDQPIDNAVTLYLFKTTNGTLRANVQGPRVFHPYQSHYGAAEFIVSVPFAEAFREGIRMANKNDIEMVVMGDARLWDRDWGRLVPPPAIAA